MINKGLSRLGAFFLYLISLLPFWMLYLIADFVFFLLYHMIGYRRKVVQENLLNSFPEKSAEERHSIEKKYYLHLADLMVETIKMVSISEKEIVKRVLTPNPEMLDHYFNQGRSVMMALGHYGNWEIANLRASKLFKCPFLIVYKPLTNQVFDEFFIKMRSRFGATLVPMKNVMRSMVKHKDEVILSAFVADQTPVKHEASFFVDFLNQPTAFFLGVEKIAKATNPVIVFCDVERVRRGYYSFKATLISENPKETAPHEITKAYVKCLEDMIKKDPPYWLWSHRRWKFKPEDIT